MDHFLRLLFIFFLSALNGASFAATPMVEGGSDFSLFLAQDGTVLAAGSDASGQLGQGRTLSTISPIPSKVSSVQKIASGFAHNLAIKQDKTLLAWGNNSEGQLGDGTNISRSMPQTVGNLAGVVAVAAGEYHSIAVLQDGSVRSWGINKDGQLGDGSLSSRLSPVAVKGIGNVKTVAAGHNHSLALMEDGTVWAWGGNYWGQLGNGTDVDAKLPVQVKLQNGSPIQNIVAIAAGHSFSVAIQQDGKILVWGYLYVDSTTESTVWTSTPTDNSLGRWVAKDVVAGRDHVLVLDQDGDLWSWGGNYYGQLGTGSGNPDETVYSIKPLWINSVSSIQAIAAGQNHSLAAKKDGSVWLWGFTRYTPEDDMYRYYTAPHQLENTTGGSSVAAGSSHSLALLANGNVLAWGDNVDGQLGDGAMTVRSVVSAVTGLSGITQVSAGNGHGLALKSDGTAWAWGAGQNGQLGIGRRANVSRPTKIETLSGVKRIAAAGAHSLAIKNDGTLWAWGNNYYGQLGDDSAEDSTKPVQVKTKVGGVSQPLANIVAACGGDSHSAAIDSSGTVWRWGYDEYDAAADTNYYYDTAIKVAAIPASKDIACGSEFTLVLANDGTVWAWGNNYYGQLGDGTDIDSYPDTTSYSLQVGGGLNNVSAIAAGSHHSLAIKKDGTVWRWGYSRYDSATGEDKYFSTPVQIDDLAQVAAIGAGDWHSLAVKSDGSVSSWGFNWAGQLADGSYEEFRSTPQLAINAAVSGILDLSPTSSNSVACPIVVQTNKTGSVDAVTAGFRLFVGDQTNCTSTRKRAAGGYQVFVAANHPSSGQWFLLKGVENGATLPAPTWAQYLGGPLPVFAANAGAGGLDEHVQATLIEGVDTRQLAGFDVYVGYGTDADEMLRANRVKRIFTLGVDGRPVIRK